MKIATFSSKGSSLTEMFVIITMAILVFGFNFGSAENQPLRCYNCRSKGVIGDCQDPFDVSENAALMNRSRTEDGGKVLPCPSGWCKKFIVENKDDFKFDLEIHHERGCLAKGPHDNQPRCFEQDSGMMCMCKGDLCNTASNMKRNGCNLYGSIIIGWIVLYSIKKF